MENTQTIGIDPLVSEYFKGLRADKAYYELNDLYLSIQNGTIKLTHRVYIQLNDLLGEVYSHRDSMHGWWYKEFQKLPNWINV